MPRTRDRRSGHARTLLTLLTFALGAPSCSRSLTTPVTPVAGRSAVASIPGAGAADREVVVTLAPGTDAGALAARLGATLVASGDGGRTAALLPPPGGSAAT